MSWSLIAHGAKGGGFNTVTTDAVNTTGANLFVVVVSDYGSTAFGTISDSTGANTYTKLTSYDNIGLTRVTIAYVVNPTTSATLTTTYAGGELYPALLTMAWSGSASAPFDGENGTGASADTSEQPGSVTPSLNGALIVTGICLGGSQGGIASINSGFTALDWVEYSGGNCFYGASGYLVQGSAAAVNPTWSWTNSTGSALAIAAFKVATGGAVKTLAALGVG